ncbi:TonB-dependent receptor [Chryseolinea sp. H1M3-3]|uniref:SusC/RagA family TonB-linked outer membrane protein n=1 Tax=Chryseolinea sp. H1M3-3 TaxID=3034144 RepID=UPI0023EB514C|nr:TonB-dependent receptor [Chryseolinea sp. H1M3-3]
MKKIFTPSRLACLLILWICSIGHFISAQAQGQRVSGKIIAETGESLPGVNILVKGTTRGVVTDTDGIYVLDNLRAEDVLVISFIGYQTQEVTVGAQTQIDVQLTPDLQTLSEIVVVGYGTQRKIETTGAIASVKSEEINQLPISNVAQGLQARVAGIQITQNSGAPGGNISVRVRGTNSINGTSEPLYVIDGIQVSNGGGITDVSPLATINPNDIESVEVLKDASATAIYGARGANGVVLITTKRGKNGVTNVSIESYYGVQKNTKTLDVLNAAEYAQLENDVYKTALYADPPAEGEGINWQDIIFRDAPIQNHQLSITGGNEKTQFALSANYFDQQGTIINSSFNRYSLRVNLDHKISERFKVGTSIMGSRNVNDGTITGVTNVGDAAVVTSSIVGAAIGAPPTLKPYRDDGTIFPFGEQFGGRYREVTNPLGIASILNQKKIDRILTNVYFDAQIAKGLTYRASFNSDMQDDDREYYSPIYIIATGDRNVNSGSAQKGTAKTDVLLHESILTYSTLISEKHSLKFTAVYGTQSTNYRSHSISANGFPNDVTSNEALQLAQTVATQSYRSKERLDSYMGRVNYGYRDKYFIDFTMRADGSSKFGANHKYGYFPAASAAWRIIEEPFLQNQELISDLKLRVSYGMTGNAGAINPYKSLSLMATGANYHLNHGLAKGISPLGISNPDLRWEKSTQANIGVDISLIKDRLNFTVDVYNKKTEDLLVDKALPFTSGYQFITTNLGDIENKGIEFSTGAYILDGPVKWRVNANISVNKNEVTNIDGGTTTERFITTYTLLKVGEPLGVFKTYVFDGIYQTGETIIPGQDGRIGGHKVKDINGDGVITSADQVITGDPNPDFIYGFSSNLQWKNFDLSVFLSGTYGNEIYNVSRASFENPLGQRNVLQGVANRWTETNPSNEFASPLQGGRLPISDRFIEDGSYLRCRNITLGYVLPVIKHISRARIYISANNLFTLTNYSGFDPEVNTFAGSNTTIGVDNFVYPSARSFIGGVQLTF